ncbi:Bifunctional heparan sulfate N-deacetylase/N-sulfotransferase 1 [Homalodisca vitripennis]|nr:Bifunctional heparan sulfate N-deacetylase/N-sulfotransferase 1 [Homalodisca vitripennis]
MASLLYQLCSTVACFETSLLSYSLYATDGIRTLKFDRIRFMASLLYQLCSTVACFETSLLSYSLYATDGIRTLKVGVCCSLIARDSRPHSYISCAVLDGATRLPQVSNNHRSAARLRIDPKVLVFVETTYSRLGREIAELLVYNRMK